jgi:REP element-mobilizing transposase RayT
MPLLHNPQMAHKGWHSRGYLPHFDSAETIQFVTFRLVDSLPRAVAEALARSADSLAETDQRLDGGLGACWLRNLEVGSMVEQALLHFDGERYRLLAWCIMPNHVHVVVAPSEGQSLGAILQAWKSFTSMRANQILGREGPFWHKDYFDRFIRDEGHLERTIGYVENNPVKAKLAETIFNWPWSSARLRARA